MMNCKSLITQKQFRIQSYRATTTIPWPQGRPRAIPRLHFVLSRGYWREVIAFLRVPAREYRQRADFQSLQSDPAGDTPCAYRLDVIGL